MASLIVIVHDELISITGKYRQLRIACASDILSNYPCGDFILIVRLKLQLYMPILIAARGTSSACQSVAILDKSILSTIKSH